MKKPNIILINCDDLGYGDLGCYGSKVNSTPNLDRMAAEGIRFTDFYMASPVCSPSRGAMMTGCYPPRIGFGAFGDKQCWVLFPGMDEGLNPAEITIASLLKKVGYATKLVGKWHCGDQPDFLPTNHGFDEYYGLPYSNDMGRQAGRPDRWPPLPLVDGLEVIQEQPDLAALTERYTEQCVRFIRKNRDKPFFLYYAHMHVHLPIFAPQKFLDKSRNGRYGAGVEQIDWATGVIFSELKKLGLDENTLVVFTSDNGSRAKGGGGSNDPLRGTKGTTWEGGQRVPCIMHWPERIPAGTVRSEITSSMDFYATFAALAEVQVPEDRIIDSIDIRSLMFGDSVDKPPRNTMVYTRMNAIEAIRCGKWKLHVLKGEDKINELYDLENDIAESENLYEKHPEVVKELTEILDTYRQDIGDSAQEITGSNCRPVGKVSNPVPMTQYDPNHPYIDAMYDLSDAG